MLIFLCNAENCDHEIQFPWIFPSIICIDDNKIDADAGNIYADAGNSIAAAAQFDRDGSSGYGGIDYHSDEYSDNEE